MAYVFDTSSFIVMGHYYPEQFPRFWEKFNQIDVDWTNLKGFMERENWSF